MLRNLTIVTCCAAAMAALGVPAIAQTSEVQKTRDTLPKSATAKPGKKRKPQAFDSGALAKQNAAFDVAEAALKRYDYGTTEPASAIFDSLTRGTSDAPAARRAFVARLVAVAANPQYSVAARELTLRRIPYVARESDVHGLFPLLGDTNAKIAEMTRYALAPIPGASISKAFRETATLSTNETLTAGLINALGSRKDGASVRFIADYTGNSSPVIASAAMNALGKIGTQDAASRLRTILNAADETAKGQVGSALAECAANLAANGNREPARSIYESLLKVKGSYGFRLFAFTGYANLSRNPSEVALKTLLSGDADLHSAAGTLLATAKDRALNQKLAAAIKGQKPETQIALLGIAQSRHAREAMVPARELLSSQTTATRSAAIAALGTVGDKSVVVDLLKIAANKEDEFAEQARTSIDQLAAPGVDDFLIRLIDPHGGREVTGAAIAETVEAIQAIGRREVTAAVPILLENAEVRQDESLQAESYNALSKSARAEDSRVLLALSYQITSQTVRTKADKALLAAVRKIEPAESQSAFLVDAIKPAPSSEARISILKLLGKLGGENSYRALKEFLTSEDQPIKDTVIRAIADFPTAEPIHDLMAIARDGSAEEVHKVLALRGAARMLGIESKRETSETVELARAMLELAATDEDKKLVISSLAEVKQPGIIELIAPSLDTEALAAETRAAILKLAPHVWTFAPQETSKTLTRISEVDMTDGQKADLRKLAEDMDKLTTDVTGSK
ncbi:MAG: HEAT repeat domain-containing protein [Candidatus Sumerlaeaceae bacterium]